LTGAFIMDRIRTLIVDDEKPARRALRGLLDKDADIEVVGEAMDGERALELVRELSPQLVFLDVQMPILSGLEMLEQLGAATTARPEIIFVTAYDHYALTAFDLHAVDYLVKPFTDARFRTALDRAKTRLRRGSLAATEEALHALLAQLRAMGTPVAPPAPANEYARLVVKADGELHFLNQRDVRWVEGQGDFVKIHLRERRLLVRLTMNKVESLLDPAQFVRIHKSAIVNLSFVRRVVPMLARSHGMELDDGTALPIGPSYRGVLERLK
jgi:two-component system LytT family response regulator